MLVWAFRVFLKFIVYVLIFKWLIWAYDFLLFLTYHSLLWIWIWIIIFTTGWVLVVFKLILVIVNIRVYLVLHFSDFYFRKMVDFSSGFASNFSNLNLILANFDSFCFEKDAILTKAYLWFIFINIMCAANRLDSFIQSSSNLQKLQNLMRHVSNWVIQTFWS